MRKSGSEQEGEQPNTCLQSGRMPLPGNQFSQEGRDKWVFSIFSEQGEQTGCKTDAVSPHSEEGRVGASLLAQKKDEKADNVFLPNDPFRTPSKQGRQVRFADEVSNHSPLASIQIFERYDHHECHETGQVCNGIHKSETNKNLLEYGRGAHLGVAEKNLVEEKDDEALVYTLSKAFFAEEEDVGMGEPSTFAVTGGEAESGIAGYHGCSMSMWFRETDDWEDLEPSNRFG